MAEPEKKTSDFFGSIYGVVREIPCGKVVTYGQIALMTGHPRAAKIVGRAMSMAPSGLACHRVVNRLGEMAASDVFGGSHIQRQMLEAEGVTFLKNGRIDLKKHIWRG